MYLSSDPHKTPLKPYLWALTRENDEKADKFETANELTLLSRMFLFSNTTVLNLPEQKLKVLEDLLKPFFSFFGVS